jgi:uncharacterized membrane protein (DUF2068 family)
MSEGVIQEHPGSVAAHAGNAVPETHHDRGLLAIGIFKLLKSTFAFCVGFGAIHLLHRDLAGVVMHLGHSLHQDPEGRVVSFLTRKVALIDVRRLREAGFFAFAYSALALTEGIGLMLEKVWAEYLTTILTSCFLPWELYELFHKPDWLRLAVLIGNLIVLGYLVWLLQRKKKYTPRQTSV